MRLRLSRFNPACYFETISEEHSTIEDLVASIESSFASYSDLLEGGARGIEYEICADSSTHGKMYVAVHAAAWMLAYLPPEESSRRYSVHDPAAPGEVEVLIPEVCTYGRDCFMPPEKAKRIIGEWVSDGRLSRLVKWET